MYRLTLSRGGRWLPALGIALLSANAAAIEPDPGSRLYLRLDGRYYKLDAPLLYSPPLVVTESASVSACARAAGTPVSDPEQGELGLMINDIALAVVGELQYEHVGGRYFELAVTSLDGDLICESETLPPPDAMFADSFDVPA